MSFFSGPAPVNYYMNRTCTKCGHPGANVKGLCISCTKGSQITVLALSDRSSCTIDESQLVGQWVKRSAVHDIEHHVARLERDGMIVTSCGQRMPTRALVPASSASGSIYRCATCLNLAEDEKQSKC
jgi:hypothetical protein